MPQTLKVVVSVWNAFSNSGTGITFKTPDFDLLEKSKGATYDKVAHSGGENGDH